MSNWLVMAALRVNGKRIDPETGARQRFSSTKSPGNDLTATRAWETTWPNWSAFPAPEIY